MILRTGSDGLERWIDSEAKRRTGMNVGDYDSRDYFAVGLGYAKPVVVNAYWCFDFARTMQLSEVYLFAILIALTLIVWVMQGASRSWKRGPVLEITTG